MQNPFQDKLNAIQDANTYGTEPPRCEVCGILLSPAPGQLIRFCSKAHRKLRHKMSRVLSQVQENLNESGNPS